MENVDAVVIGAGAVGLAVARAMAMTGREVLILESQNAFGTGVSSRNSEVLHAGLYYPTGSFKAQLCVRGRALLLDFMKQAGVPHRLTGKLVVATEEAEVPAIERLFAQAQANGVQGIELIDGAKARGMEPSLRAVAALHSPATGIVDSHALMMALLGEAQAHGAQLALCSAVVGGEVLGDGTLVLDVRAAEGGGAAEGPAGGPSEGTVPMRLHARTVVNAAGLTAPALARRIQGVPVHTIPTAHYCKGHYFSLQGKAPFSRLIYPVHTSAGLGTHLTLDLGGQARFGPDVEWLGAQGAVGVRRVDEPVAQEGHAGYAGHAGQHAHAAPARRVEPCVPDDLGLDYRVDETRCSAFERDIRRYWPGLPDEALLPAYTGIRPKTVGPGEPAADFTISAPAQHGVAGWVGLYGIESPGLTACIALGEAVVQALRP